MLFWNCVASNLPTKASRMQPPVLPTIGRYSKNTTEYGVLLILESVSNWRQNLLMSEIVSSFRRNKLHIFNFFDNEIYGIDLVGRLWEFFSQLQISFFLQKDSFTSDQPISNWPIWIKTQTWALYPKKLCWEYLSTQTRKLHFSSFEYTSKESKYWTWESLPRSQDVQMTHF